MPEWILAESGIESWINIIIIVLVVGGSFISAILKALIKKFSPKEETPSKKVPRVKFDRPIAKPMPGHPVQTAQPRPPTTGPRPPVRVEKSRRKPEQKPMVELPVELPEIFAELFPDIVAPRPPKDRIPHPSESSSRTQRSDKPKSKKSRRVVRSQSTQSHVAKARKVEATAPKHTTTEERLGTLKSSFELDEERLGHVETRIGPGMDPHPGSADLEEGHDAYDIPIPVDEFKAGVFHVDRQDLRRAIILNEILSPPLALREEEM